ncbi:hypothetical protein Tco_0909839 [Tanacetum coccineum]|uniref:Uncharacterized protein n=1 Tax=Tanacetum coccineum TaxID=301880 RepID=A0ABQ5CXH2_9ASTR
MTKCFGSLGVKNPRVSHEILRKPSYGNLDVQHGLDHETQDKPQPRFARCGSAIALDHLKNYNYSEADKEAHVREFSIIIPCFSFKDDGNGMDPEAMRHCLSFVFISTIGKCAGGAGAKKGRQAP